MGAAFWIRRFILVWTAAFVLIAGAQALKGHGLAYAPTQGLLWATISAGIFLRARLYQVRPASPIERLAEMEHAELLASTSIGCATCPATLAFCHEGLRADHGELLSDQRELDASANR